jgi:uncharacterized protein YjbJ (UPF0337 family)
MNQPQAMTKNIESNAKEALESLTDDIKAQMTGKAEQV